MKCVVLVGQSSVGKDSILNQLLLHDICIEVVSHTTRPQRENETQGKEYHFIDNEKFQDMEINNEFIEKRLYNTKFGQWKYGMAKSAIDINSKHIYVAILDLQGLKQLEEYIGKENVISVYLEANTSTRLIRSIEREKDKINKEALIGKTTTIDEINRRIKADNEDFKNAEHYCDVTLPNETKDDIDTIVSCICGLVY